VTSVTDVSESPPPSLGARRAGGAGGRASGRLETRAPAAATALQRSVDVLISGVGMLLFTPIAIPIAVAIRLDSRGPVLYRQLRIGIDRRDDAPPGPEALTRRTLDLGGRPFTIYKFRTMCVDAEAETGPVWAAPNDARVTRVGRLLRRYRLDEVPQLWNVLRGDMSIVGPRPERPVFVQRLSSEVEDYPLRHRVRPGITGWAQVNQEPDQSVDDVRGKLRYDLEYLEKKSFRFDLGIMIKTVPVMIQRVRRRQ